MNKLLIDIREHKIINLFENKQLSNIPEINYECQTLDLGDFIYKKENDTLLILERKTLEDLYANYNYNPATKKWEYKGEDNLT